MIQRFIGHKHYKFNKSIIYLQLGSTARFTECYYRNPNRIYDINQLFLSIIALCCCFLRSVQCILGTPLWPWHESKGWIGIHEFTLANYTPLYCFPMLLWPFALPPEKLVDSMLWISTVPLFSITSTLLWQPLNFTRLNTGTLWCKLWTCTQLILWISFCRPAGGDSE